MPTNPVLEKTYDPASVEPEMYALWKESGAFTSKPDERPRERTFCIVIPPPNVTGALHLGHALNNTLQDILVRYHRMRGFNTLWQPGTDHAGIATQAVVERRILKDEGLTRHQLGRDELVRRIWEWKDQYEKRILGQLELMGCSCDWTRKRFTLDDGLRKAVRHQFFRLFKDGLIFRGKRLVNWDTELQTAVANDEVYHESVKGHFWHFKYPVIDPKPGEPDHVIIATTRPETMLGDTAVAVHPDPEGFFAKAEAELRDLCDRSSNRSSKDADEAVAKLAALHQRHESHLAGLVTLSNMARDGRMLQLPLVERKIPLITDEWANPMKGSGCVKITPAHDPNDYEVGLRHPEIGPPINVLSPDGTIAKIIETDGAVNPRSSDYEGLAFSTEGRRKVVAGMEALDLVHDKEDHEVEIGYSDRSKTPIEPFLSDQWFVQTEDINDDTLGRRDRNAADKNDKSVGLGTSGKRASGLAQAAMEAVKDGRVTVFPERYRTSYLDWLREKRNWCISRQLWWGHRIAVWTTYLSTVTSQGLFGRDDASDSENEERLQAFTKACDIDDDIHWRKTIDLRDGHHATEICTLGEKADEAVKLLSEFTKARTEGDRAGWKSVSKSFEGRFGKEALQTAELLANRIRWQRSEQSRPPIVRDEDVLDTWFSSALWPFSTLGWPEQTDHLKQYYPGAVLVTSRDIITNWVARMVMFGLYSMGEVPFRHVYIHPKILDGRGETMSKSKGNGVDPVDAIHTHGADAMRYALADLTTETQDVRMPVEYVCPHCGKLTDQAVALKAEAQARKSRGEKLDRKLQPIDCLRITCANHACGKPFASQWATDELKEELGLGRETSDKFDIGRNFCTKLWNAARFAFMNLEGTECHTLDIASLPPEDRWILARLSQTIRRYHDAIAKYQFSASVKILREFFWEALCDWYIELTKPRFTSDAGSSDAPSGNAESTSPEPRASARAISPEPNDAPSPANASARAVSPKSNDTRAAASATAKQVLAFSLDQILRLFHPTIPHITERLWQTLGSVAPKRGLPGIADLNTDTHLVLAEFPPVEGYPAFDDESILDVFADLQAATRGVRELRSKCGVLPRQRVAVTIVAPEDHIESFKGEAHVVKHMAGIGTLSIVTRAARPANSASVTIGGLRIFVHDISDDQADRTRTKTALADVEKQVVGKEKKLSNEKFVTNAKPEVVAAERTRLEELVNERDTLTAHLSELEA